LRWKRPLCGFAHPQFASPASAKAGLGMLFYAFALAYPVWQTVINNQTLRESFASKKNNLESLSASNIFCPIRFRYEFSLLKILD
jgi:hypothetical protein